MPEYGENHHFKNEICKFLLGNRDRIEMGERYCGF